MPSKFNYFVYKEQNSIFPNHFNRYLEVVKEGCGVLKTAELSLFAREASKPVTNTVDCCDCVTVDTSLFFM